MVKIVVGNKLDKEFSRQVPTSLGASFAKSMGSLFIETSAKTATGVREAFGEVVERILDTPELWQSGGQQRTDGGRGGVPGGVQVVGLGDSASSSEGGCSC